MPLLLDGESPPVRRRGKAVRGRAAAASAGTATPTALAAGAAAPAAAVPLAQALGALALANARYWLGVSGQVRGQLWRWQARAEAIEDPVLRALALAKLREEGFNAQAAAVLATFAPRAQRAAAVRAIVALELLYDCLDGLSERPHSDPLGEGERLFAAYVGAVRPGVAAAGVTGAAESVGSRAAAGLGAEGYLAELACAVAAALAELPAFAAVAEVAQRCALRSAQAQIQMHAAATLGAGGLERWARAQAREEENVALDWREYAAGAAASVLTLHALIAAAADPRTTAADARRIETAYASLCAVVTLLDSVVDRACDAGSGELAYITLYPDRKLLALSLARMAAVAVRECAALPGGAHHLTVLASAAAYWCSHPAAGEAEAAATLAPLRRELRPLLVAPMLTMRAWRAARRVRAW